MNNIVWNLVAAGFIYQGRRITAELLATQNMNYSIVRHPLTPTKNSCYDIKEHIELYKGLVII